jgi:hypothetical protein
MKNAKYIAIAGSVVGFIGMYLPTYESPLAGTNNFFGFPLSESLLLLMLLVASFTLALTNRLQHVIWTGGAALMVVAFKCYQTYSALTNLTENLNEAYDPIVAEVFASELNSNSLGLGWPTLILATLLLTGASIIARASSQIVVSDEDQL